MSVFFFNDTSTPEIYTLSLHDALPISTAMATPVSPRPEPEGDGGRRPGTAPPQVTRAPVVPASAQVREGPVPPDRKSTRLNSSHANISYAVFCLKKNTTNLDCKYIRYI